MNPKISTFLQGLAVALTGVVWIGVAEAAEYTLTAEEIDWEPRPGLKLKGWAFNGQIPGPEIRTAVLTACAPGQRYRTTGEPSSGEAIAKARTKADHEALVVRYEREAEALRARAERCRRIAGYYRQYGGPWLVRRLLMEHYVELAVKFGEAAAESLCLAKLHRQWAMQMQP
jgi:hypothetical protein